MIQSKTKVAKLVTQPVCWVTGPATKLHEMTAVMRRRERAGEVEILGPVRAHPQAPHLITQPYILRGRRAAWVRRKRAALIVGGSVGVYALVALALIWEARFLLVQAAGGLLFLAALAWLCTRTRHSGACAGLHCPGCRG